MVRTSNMRSPCFYHFANRFCIRTKTRLTLAHTPTSDYTVQVLVPDKHTVAWSSGSDAVEYRICISIDLASDQGLPFYASL